MHERKAIRFLLLFSAFMILTTCQFQFNNEGKGLGIRLLVPASVSGGARSTNGAKSLAGGTGVTLTITTQAGTQWATSPLLDINGSSVSYSFSLPPTGSYLASAELFGGSGSLISQASTPFSVPVQTNPVTLSVSSGQVVVSYFPAGPTNPSTAVSQGFTYAINALGTPIVFQVNNADSSNTLYPFGSSPVTMTDTYGEYIISSQLPSTPIPPGGTADFAIEMVNNSGPSGSETVTLRTSDPSNTPFVFLVNPS